MTTWLTSQTLKCSCFDIKIRRRKLLAKTSTVPKEVSVQVEKKIVSVATLHSDPYAKRIHLYLQFREEENI